MGRDALGTSLMGTGEGMQALSTVRIVLAMADLRLGCSHQSPRQAAVSMAR